MNRILARFAPLPLGVRAIAASFRDPDYAATPQPAGGFSEPQPAYGAQVLPYPAMFSAKKDCPSCGYKTVTVTTTVLEHATYDHAGRERVEKDCRHCGWSDVDIVHLPRKERPTTSSRSLSSSGGGSSGGGWSGGGGGGGGSSSGRGASGRW
jgi:uncharacterized membrane protein YgcG